MPNPLSNTYFNQEVDYEALPRDMVLEQLTPRALLERTKNAVLSNWQEAIPKDATGRPYQQRGAAEPLLNMVTGRTLTKGDSTGTVSVGPYGISINNIPQQDPDSNEPPIVRDQKDVWNLQINPLARGASFNKGDFGIGGTYGADKSGFIRKGPFRLDAGYGSVTPYLPSEEIAPANSYKVEATPAEGWVKLGVELGTPKEFRMTNVMPELQSRLAVDQAVEPYRESKSFAPVSEVKSASEEADEFLKKYREENEGWWRP